VHPLHIVLVNQSKSLSQFENLPQQDNKKMGGNMEAGLTQILLVRRASFVDHWPCQYN
jgi:hypothetical protein